MRCLVTASIVLAGLLATSAGIASSAVGTDHVFSSKLALSLPPQRGERVISSFKPTVSRSPTGFLYLPPFRLPDTEHPLTLSLGLLAHDDEETAAQYREFSDWDGAFVGALTLDRLFEGGTAVTARAGSIAREDQYYWLRVDRPEDFRVTLYYNEIPHVFVDRAALLHRGVGSDRLTLPGSLTPGSNTPAALAVAVSDAPLGTVELRRERMGIKFAYELSGVMGMFANYAVELRDGGRPFAGSFYPPFYSNLVAGAAVELVEPIDYETHEAALGLQFTAERTHANLTVNASWFRNGNASLTWENPFADASFAGYVVEEGRAALAPDNQSVQLLGQIVHLFDSGQRIEGQVSWADMRQDEDLLPPTINSGIDLGLWNSVAALSRRSADAQITTTAAKLKWSLPLGRRLHLSVEARRYDENNDTAYTALNPLTGEYGYITEDGAHFGSVHQTGVASLPYRYRSIPFEKSTSAAEANLRVRPTSRQSWVVTLQRTDFDYTGREVDSAEERGIGVKATIRSIPRTNVRLRYDYVDRTTGRYDPYPYDAYYTSSLPDYISFLPEGPPAHTLNELRKHDLAARETHKGNLRINFMLADTSDLSFNGAWLAHDYDASYGLTEREVRTVDVQWNYQPSGRLNVYIGVGRQHTDDAMRSNQDTGFSTDGSAGGPHYGTEGEWHLATDEASDFLTGGVHGATERWNFDLSFNYTNTEGDTGYTAASPQAAGAAGGGGFSLLPYPDLEYVSRVVDLSVTWLASSRVQLRGFYRFEENEIRDWHLTGLTPVIGQHLFLSNEPPDYSVNTIGVVTTLKL